MERLEQAISIRRSAAARDEAARLEVGLARGGAASEDTAILLHNTALARAALGQRAAAAAAGREAAAALRQHLGPSHQQTLQAARFAEIMSSPPKAGDKVMGVY